MADVAMFIDWNVFQIIILHMRIVQDMAKSIYQYKVNFAYLVSRHL